MNPSNSSSLAAVFLAIRFGADVSASELIACARELGFDVADTAREYISSASVCVDFRSVLTGASYLVNMWQPREGGRRITVHLPSDCCPSARDTACLRAFLEAVYPACLIEVYSVDSANEDGNPADDRSTHELPHSELCPSLFYSPARQAYTAPVVELAERHTSRRRHLARHNTESCRAASLLATSASGEAYGKRNPPEDLTRITPSSSGRGRRIHSRRTHLR